jgi:hypothetical protein
MGALLANNAEVLIAILALVIALQANIIARRAKLDSDRLLLSGKKRDLLHEIDRQHVTLLRLRFVMQGQQLQFELCPQLFLVDPEEKERVLSNLNALDRLEESCLKARENVEAINIKHDPAEIDVQFAAVCRLTAHLEKDLEHEQELLDSKKRLVATADEYEGGMGPL